MNELLFTCYLERATFDLIMTRFFKTVGYIDQNCTLEFEELEFDNDKIVMKAGMTEETVQ